jgi:hypothetical protein
VIFNEKRVPPTGHLTMFGDILIAATWLGECYCPSRTTTEHPTILGQPPTTKNCPFPNANSTVVEKPSDISQLSEFYQQNLWITKMWSNLVCELQNQTVCNLNSILYYQLCDLDWVHYYPSFHIWRKKPHFTDFYD